MSESTISSGAMLPIEARIWMISNILQTLYVAMPEDVAGCDVPARSLVMNVADLATDLAKDVSEMQTQAALAQMREGHGD